MADKESPTTKRTVLITGCSDDGLGAALAIAFHEAGLHVYATARDPSKMAHIASLGIETLTLDVQSDSSIAACVQNLSSLDILVNNAGAGFNMPFSDVSIAEGKKLFDLNVWSYVAVTQAFLSLLLKSKGMIVNNTSIASSMTMPFQSVYNASKAAIATFSDTQRLELAPFGIKVVDLKTGVVSSSIYQKAMDNHLPKGSIYEPAKEAVEKVLRNEDIVDLGIPAEQWARGVVQDLLRKTPPPNIWRGSQAWLVRLVTMLPFGMSDGLIKKMAKLDVVEQMVRK